MVCIHNRIFLGYKKRWVLDFFFFFAVIWMKKRAHSSLSHLLGLSVRWVTREWRWRDNRGELLGKIIKQKIAQHEVALRPEYTSLWNANPDLFGYEALHRWETEIPPEKADLSETGKLQKNLIVIIRTNNSTKLSLWWGLDYFLIMWRTPGQDNWGKFLSDL